MVESLFTPRQYPGPAETPSKHMTVGISLKYCWSFANICMPATLTFGLFCMRELSLKSAGGYSRIKLAKLFEQAS